MHTRPRGCPIGSARRASERGATWTRQVSPSPMGISSCRAIDGVVAACQGRAVTVTGSGPRVVPGWGKGGPPNVVLSGSGGDGTNGDGRARVGAALAGVGPIDCHAAQRKWLCVMQSQEAKGFLARWGR